MNDEKLMDVLPILMQEYSNALRKHPAFARTRQEVVSIIAEELGELAKEINDEAENNRIGLTRRCFNERAMIEAAHVAVTAIRTMQILNDKRSVFHG